MTAQKADPGSRGDIGNIAEDIHAGGWPSRPGLPIALAMPQLGGVQARQNLLPEVVRQQCLRWQGEPA